MQKVCHLTSVHKRYDTRIYQKQCRSLSLAGYDVTLVCADNQPDEIIDGVKIKSIALIAGNPFSRIIKARKKILKAAIEADAEIYQIHDPELIPVGIKLLGLGKKVIYDSHEDLPRQIIEKEWIPKPLRKILSLLAEYYLRKTLKKFPVVLTVSPHIARVLEKITKKVEVITNYPILEDDYESFTSESYALRPDVLCYSGTVYKISQQNMILEALNRVDSMHYILVGTIDKPYFEKLSKLPAWEKTKFIEKVPKQALLKIYNEVTIGIVVFDYSPNLGYKEGTLGNNKIFEYMQAGLPIICTDFKVWKEIVDTYSCGICVNPNEPDEIKEAIEYLKTNKEMAYTYGQNGRAAVMKEYNWKTQEEKLLKVYKTLISQN